MKAKDIRFYNGKYRYLFELPLGYGYAMMLDMAQFVIDSYFGGRILSFRVSLLPGLKEREYKHLLRLHRNCILKCKIIQREQGVICLKGRSLFLDDKIEIVWFNQTKTIGVAGNFEDTYHTSRVELMIDSIIRAVMNSSFAGEK